MCSKHLDTECTGVRERDQHLGAAVSGECSAPSQDPRTAARTSAAPRDVAHDNGVASPERRPQDSSLKRMGAGRDCTHEQDCRLAKESGERGQEGSSEHSAESRTRGPHGPRPPHLADASARKRQRPQPVTRTTLDPPLGQMLTRCPVCGKEVSAALCSQHLDEECTGASSDAGSSQCATGPDAGAAKSPAHGGLGEVRTEAALQLQGKDAADGAENKDATRSLTALAAELTCPIW